MKRFLIISVIVLLLGVMVMVVRCSSNNSQNGNVSGNNGSNLSDQVNTCLGNIAVVVTSTLVDGEALTFGKLVSSASVCVDAALAIFSPPSASTPSSPEIDIKSSSSDGTFSGAVQSSTIGNCTDSTRALQFDFYVPFEMVVGPRGDQKAFNGSPNGSSDDELIAHQLFEQYNNEIASTTTYGPSQSEIYNVEPHTQVTYTLPIKLYYIYGEARVVHTDGTMVSLPWYFIDGYQQAGPITATVSSC